MPLLPDLPPPELVDPAPFPARPLRAAREEDRASDDAAGAPVRDFGPGEVELSLRLGFDGFGYGPLSILGAFAGWNELQLHMDAGVLAVQDVGIGIGFEAFAARPWLYEALSRGFVNLFVAEDARFAWQAWDRGVAARTTFHYTPLEVLDPYGFLLLGPRHYTLDVSTTSGGTELSARTTSWGLRMGGGAGVSVVAGRGWLATVELRYLVSLRFDRVQTLTLTDADGEETALYTLGRYARGPRGFSWVIGAARRF